MPNPFLASLFAGLGTGLTAHGTRARQDELDQLERQRELEDANREILQQRQAVMRELQMRGAQFGGTAPAGYEQMEFAGIEQPAFVPRGFTAAGQRMEIERGLTGLTPPGSRTPISATGARLLSYNPELSDFFISRTYSPSTIAGAEATVARTRAADADRLVQAANGNLNEAIRLGTQSGSNLTVTDIQAAVTRFQRRGRGSGVNIGADSTATPSPQPATGGAVPRPRPATGTSPARPTVRFNP